MRLPKNCVVVPAVIAKPFATVALAPMPRMHNSKTNKSATVAKAPTSDDLPMLLSFSGSCSRLDTAHLGTAGSLFGAGPGSIGNHGERSSCGAVRTEDPLAPRGSGAFGRQATPEPR